MTVPVQAFKEASKGSITAKDLVSLGDFDDLLKTGAVYTPGVGYGSHASNLGQMGMDAAGLAGSGVMATGRGVGSAINSPLGAGIITMGAGVVGAVAAPMIAHGIRAVQNKLTYRRDLNRLLDVRPEISGDNWVATKLRCESPKEACTSRRSGLSSTKPRRYASTQL